MTLHFELHQNDNQQNGHFSFVVILLNVVLLNVVLALYGSLSLTLPLSITMLNIRTFSTKGLIVTLSIIDAQHNNTISSDIMVNIFMLNVVMLSVIMLSVVAPIFTLRQKSL